MLSSQKSVHASDGSEAGIVSVTMAALTAPMNPRSSKTMKKRTRQPGSLLDSPPMLMIPKPSSEMVRL
jgi:hypothetical protein